MHRRKFIHLLSGFAAIALLKSVQAFAQAASPAGTLPSTYPDRFNKLTQDYASFCATSENERVFYAFRNGQIISERFNPGDYKASACDPPQPSLSVSGGSHDGVPMISPVAGLQGDGPHQPTWESLLAHQPARAEAGFKLRDSLQVEPQSVIATGKAFPGRRRPLCAYPKHAEYKGNGDTQDANNFESR